MRYNKEKVSLEDRIVRASLPYWWPVITLLGMYMLYMILFLSSV